MFTEYLLIKTEKSKLPMSKKPKKCYGNAKKTNGVYISAKLQ